MIEMVQVEHTGVNLTRCLLLDDALVSVGVSRSGNKELIFYLNDPPHITLKFPALVLNAKNKQ